VIGTKADLDGYKPYPRPSEEAYNLEARPSLN